MGQERRLMRSNFLGFTTSQKQSILDALLYMHAATHSKLLRTRVRSLGRIFLGHAEASIVHQIEALKQELGIPAGRKLHPLKESLLSGESKRFVVEIGSELFDAISRRIALGNKPLLPSLKRRASKRRLRRQK